MARFRVTARKSVAPVLVQEMIPSDLYHSRTRAQAAIRMKQLAINNQDRIIRNLRTSNAEKRRETEYLTIKLTSAEKRVNEISNMFELARGDTYNLRDTVNAAVGQAKRATEEVVRLNQELEKVSQAQVGDKRRLEEAWTVIQQLSENNQRLSMDIEKGKAKRKKLKEKHDACHLEARNLLNEAENEIQEHKIEISNLKEEKENLQLQLAELLDPEEDPEEEEEEALPVEAVGNEDIDD